jgi:hypothetical protein
MCFILPVPHVLIGLALANSYMFRGSVSHDFVKALDQIKFV